MEDILKEISYKLKEFKTGQDIELIANDDFFEGRPKIDRILYKFLPDPNTSFLYLKQKGYFKNADIDVTRKNKIL